jgi:hypothetical protein
VERHGQTLGSAETARARARRSTPGSADDLSWQVGNTAHVLLCALPAPTPLSVHDKQAQQLHASALIPLSVRLRHSHALRLGLALAEPAPAQLPGPRAGHARRVRTPYLDPLTTTTATGTLRSPSPLLGVRCLHGQRRPPCTTPGARKACLTGCARTPPLRSWICLASVCSTSRSKYASHTMGSACASYLLLASQPHPCLLPTPAPSSPRPLTTR